MPDGSDAGPVKEFPEQVTWVGVGVAGRAS